MNDAIAIAFPVPSLRCACYAQVMQKPYRLLCLLGLLFLACAALWQQTKMRLAQQQVEEAYRAAHFAAAQAAIAKKEPVPATLSPPRSGVKRQELSESVWLEVDGQQRRVVVAAKVCLRKGEYGLECLLCRRGTKEHESILNTDADAQMIHAALLAAKARPGSPVRFEPEFKSPTGTPIRVSLRYDERGKTVTVPARQWVRHARTKKELDHDWVFAGSVLWKDPDDKDRPPVYVATVYGDYISISNLPTALLDLPVNSPKSLAERAFEPNTERIPELETKVDVILEPVEVPQVE